MLESVYHLDWNIFKFIENYLWNPVLDVIMKVITLSGQEGIIFFIVALAYLLSGIVKHNGRNKKIAVAIVISICVMTVLNNLLIKDLVARVRPFNFDWSQFSWGGEFNYPDIVSRPTSWSFPSGHASSAFAAGFACFYYDKKYGSLLLIFADIMAFSRIYVHAHYFTDVLAGAVVGITCGLIGVLITKFAFDFIDKKIFSKIENRIV